jgi:glycosyltransferase involved in cell wall biosynthesis
MQKAKAFVFAAEEDFGIIPVEAQACGTPVITYSHGACRETNLEKVTGLFFHEQSIKAICDSVKQFENCQHTFVPSVIRQNAEQFSRDRFCREYSNFVKKAYEEFHSV